MPPRAVCGRMLSFLSPSAVLLVLAVSATAEPRPRLTTDSVEYCSTLAARVAGLPKAREEPSRTLAAEGVKLCDDGHVRSGIAKLRRAVRAAQVMP